jgi:hypothetical protein
MQRDTPPLGADKEEHGMNSTTAKQHLPFMILRTAEPGAGKAMTSVQSLRNSSLDLPKLLHLKVFPDTNENKTRD